MNNEMKRLIKMVEDGKLTSDEATKLIEAMNDGTTTTNNTPSQSYMEKSLKIRIYSEEKQKVRLNIPIKFVKWILKTGHGIASAIPDAKPYVDDINLDVIMEAIDKEVEGKIIDLTSDEGETIEIYIE